MHSCTRKQSNSRNQTYVVHNFLSVGSSMLQMQCEGGSICDENMSYHVERVC